MLIDKGALIDKKNDDGKTPLNLASSGNFIEATKLLLKRGAARKKALTNNPLLSTDLKQVTCLLQCGAKLDFPDDKSQLILAQAQAQAALRLDFGR